MTPHKWNIYFLSSAEVASRDLSQMLHVLATILAQTMIYILELGTLKRSPSGFEI